MKPIIAVVGITGHQGGAVAKALLKHGKYSIRGLTRDPDSDRAKNDCEGCELVKADMDDELSLAQAFLGCHGAFLMSDYWGNGMDAERELQAIKNMGNAAKTAKLQHVVFSFLEDTRKLLPEDTACPTLEGKFKVPQFDVKGEGKAWMEQLGIPATYLLTSPYYTNFLAPHLRPHRGASGEPLAFTLPIGGDSKFLMCDPDDMGAFVANVLDDKSTVGMTLGLCSELTTCHDIADAFSEVLGEKVAYHATAPATYAALGFRGAPALANMFRFFAECQDHMVVTRANPDVLARYLPEPKAFRAWVHEHRDEFKAAAAAAPGCHGSQGA